MIVFAKPEDLETWSNHFSFHFLIRVLNLSNGCSDLSEDLLIGNMVLVRIASHLKASVLFSNSPVNVHASQPYRNIETTREHISFTFDPNDMLCSLQIGFSYVRTAVACYSLLRSHHLKQLLRST